MPPIRREHIDQCPQTGQIVHVVVIIPSQGKPTYTCDSQTCPIKGAPGCPVARSYMS